MADNFTWQESDSGLEFASDDVGGVHYQRVKLDVGADGSAAPVVGSLPVKIAENGKTMLRTKVALAASQTAATVLDPTSGKKFVLKKVIVSAKTAGDVYFFDETDDAAHSIGPAFTFGVGGGWTEQWDDESPLRSAAADNILKYTSGAGLTGSIYLCYYEE